MRVVIAGGGNVGTYMAGALRRGGHDVTIVESDPDRVARATMNDDPPGVAWLTADACEVSEFTRARPDEADVVCAVTGDDEDNLVISLLAKQEFGVDRVIARVNNPDNEWMFDDRWGVDVAVSTPHLLTALVEEAVSVGTIVRLLRFEGGRARLVEVVLAAASPATGHTVAELGLPPSCTVVAVLRHDRLVVPGDGAVLQAGDEVLVLLTDDAEDEIRRHLVG